MNWLDDFMIDAWTGEEPSVAHMDSAQTLSWALKENLPKEWDPTLAPLKRADPKQWSHPQVGWGLILPYRQGLSETALAEAADAPEAIRRLRAARGDAPVFRYRPDTFHNFSHLITYRSGAAENLPLHSTPSGMMQGEIPYYLLIYATPEEIPWRFQYNLNSNHAVGRLDLQGDGLNNYIDALLNDWQDASISVERPVVWAVDHGPNDITRLMRDSIAAKIYDAFLVDNDIGNKASFIDGLVTPATGQNLINALSQNHPGLVVTTSHGQTGPLTDLREMERNLGLPIDQNHQLLPLDQLLARWEPDGAIWYSHACCSAGSDRITYYDGLFPASSPIDRILKGISQLGSKIAPLPKLLLGAKKPLRAFIGHVEPTFNWTLRQPGTQTYLTAPIRNAFFNGLYQPDPVGLALRHCYDRLGSFYIHYEQALEIFDGNNTKDSLLFYRLAARDIQSMVILGDPTVTLPSL